MAGRGKGSKKPSKPPVQPPIVPGWMDRTKWHYKLYNMTIGNRTITSTPLTQEANGLSFSFPEAPRMVNAMLRQGQPLAGVLKVSVQLVGAGELIRTADATNTCDSPAKVRAFVEGVGWDNWYMPDGSERPGARYLRWWSNPESVVLQDGVNATMSIPIHPEYWSSVYGAFGNESAETLLYFNQVMGGPLQVGLAFGAGCYFGHGLFVQGGTSKFTLTDFRTEF